MLLSLPSSLQISPCPSNTYQNSLTVAWTVALFIWCGGTVLWIMLPVLPSIRKRMSAPAGDFASGGSGSTVVFILLSSNFICCFFEVSVQHVQGTGVNETLTHEGMMALHNYYGRRRWLTVCVMPRRS